MKALVGAFNQEKAVVGAFSVIVQPVVEPMEHYTALVQVYSLVTGLVIEEHPAWFLYIMSATAVCITASFTMMSLIAKIKHCMSGHTDKV